MQCSASIKTKNRAMIWMTYWALGTKWKRKSKRKGEMTFSKTWTSDSSFGMFYTFIKYHMGFIIAFIEILKSSQI
jgi:hypothetical protein